MSLRERRIVELQAEQGWTDGTLLSMAEDFIGRLGQMDAYIRDLEDAAKEENAFDEADDDDDD